MRPSYRFAVVVGVVVLVASAVAIPVLWVAPPVAERPVVPLVPPLDVAPLPPRAGPPSEKTVDEMLDCVEAAEIERFGPEEAGRRRRTREQLIQDRLHPEPE